MSILYILVTKYKNKIILLIKYLSQKKKNIYILAIAS